MLSANFDKIPRSANSHNLRLLDCPSATLRNRMTWAEQYRRFAAELQAKSQNQALILLRTHWDDLAQLYLRLAEEEDAKWQSQAYCYPCDYFDNRPPSDSYINHECKDRKAPREVNRAALPQGDARRARRASRLPGKAHPITKRTAAAMISATEVCRKPPFGQASVNRVNDQCAGDMRKASRRRAVAYTRTTRRRPVVLVASTNTRLHWLFRLGVRRLSIKHKN